jgi:hypothetical protein
VTVKDGAPALLSILDYPAGVKPDYPTSTASQDARIAAARAELDALLSEAASAKVENATLREALTKWMDRYEASIARPHDGEYVKGGNHNGAFIHVGDCEFCNDRAALASAKERPELLGLRRKDLARAKEQLMRDEQEPKP